VTNALERRLTQEEFDPATRGRLFEQWVVLECLRHVDLARSGARLYFWRTNTGAEVDLLVEKHGRIQAAIEIKSSRTIDGSDLKDLRSFRGRIQTCRRSSSRRRRRRIDSTAYS